MSKSINGSEYTLVIVDKFSRYTCVIFMRRKSDTTEEIITFIKKMENCDDVKVKKLRSDNKAEL